MHKIDLPNPISSSQLPASFLNCIQDEIGSVIRYSEPEAELNGHSRHQFHQACADILTENAEPGCVVSLRFGNKLRISHPDFPIDRNNILGFSFYASLQTEQGEIYTSAELTFFYDESNENWRVPKLLHLTRIFFDRYYYTNFTLEVGQEGSLFYSLNPIKNKSGDIKEGQHLGNLLISHVRIYQK